MGRWQYILLVVALPMSTGLCGARPVPYQGEITITLLPPEELDPSRLATGAELLVAAAVHETLLRRTDGGDFKPALARDVRPSDDFREWTILLRVGECFHNGSPLEARDVTQSFERLLRRETASAYWWLLSMIDGALEFRQGRIRRLRGLEVVNRATIKVRLTRSFPDFPEVLASLPAAVLPSSWIARRSAAPPPGAGPFMLASGVSPTLELRPFLRHVQGRPFLARWTFRAPVPPEVPVTFLAPGSRAPEGEVPDREASPELRPIRRWPVFLVHNPLPSPRWPARARDLLVALLDRSGLAEAVGDTAISDDGTTGLGTEPAATVTAREARAQISSWTLQRYGLPPLVVLLIRPDEGQRTLAARMRADAARAGLVLAVQEKSHDDYAVALGKDDWDVRLEEMPWSSEDEELRALQRLALLGGEDAVREADATLRRLPPGEERVSYLRELTEKRAGGGVRPLLTRVLRFYLPEELAGVGWRAGVPDLSDAWLRTGEK